MGTYAETTLHIRVPPKLKRDLDKEAKQQERTISQLVRFILMERQRQK